MLSIRGDQAKKMADSQPGTKITEPCRKSWIEFRLVDRDNKPARATVESRLATPDTRVEIMMICSK